MCCDGDYQTVNRLQPGQQMAGERRQEVFLPDHHIDGGHHRVPLGDEAEEDEAVEDGPQDPDGGEEGPPAGESVLALQMSWTCHIARQTWLRQGSGEEEVNGEDHQAQSTLHGFLNKLSVFVC